MQTSMTPAAAAPYCLARMRKLTRTGARKHVPLLAEITAVESMEPVKIQLLLPDDTTQVRARARFSAFERSVSQMNAYSQSSCVRLSEGH